MSAEALLLVFVVGAVAASAVMLVAMFVTDWTATTIRMLGLATWSGTLIMLTLGAGFGQR